MSRPAIIHKSRFITSKSRKFKSYIDYIDRDEATRTYKFSQFSLYNDYMGNPEKSGSIFTNSKNYLNKKDLEKLKEKFEMAQKNGSIMWQDVFSFDNEWLIENGYYDKETHILNEEKLRLAVRKSMRYVLEKDNMNSALWSASFHYNTNNIHVHIATVDLSNNPRKRGKRTPNTLKQMKSRFVNELISRNETYKKINELIRDNIVKNRENFLSSKDKVLREKTLQLIKNLPNNQRYWYYGYNKIDSIKPLLNSISHYYIKTYHKKEYDELIRNLNKKELELKRIYGEGNKEMYKDYKKNELNNLYKRMGNSILTELREYAKEEYKYSKSNSNNEKTNEYKESKSLIETHINSKRNESENRTDSKTRYNGGDSKNNKSSDFINKEWDNFYKDRIVSEIKKGNENNKKNSHYNQNSIVLNRRAISNLKKVMKNEVEKYINQREYERAEREKEYENLRNNEMEI